MTTYYTRSEIETKYYIKPSLFNKWFYPYGKIYKKNGKVRRKYKDTLIEQIFSNKNFLKEYEISLTKKKKGSVGTINRSIDKSTFADVLNDILNIDRSGIKYILHIGPTNSGKTYNAIQALKKAKNGIYLGPLRLLALEIFDTLNKDGTFCTLETGEELIEVPFSTVTSSTIEMMDMDVHYDVAVIDEAQCITSIDRGNHWTRAIFNIDADEIHICMAPEAEELIVKLLVSHNATYVINRYERLSPLKYCGIIQDIKDILPGDCLIAFSRKKVLSIAADLEAKGISTSVIYGNLPPEARKEEVRRFANGESTVVVATDAIGMGVSLPIKRIVFCEVRKFDGREKRLLNPSEIKQIAGRAGRYGKFEYGEVVSMINTDLVDKALSTDISPIEKLTIPFPKEYVTSYKTLNKYIDEWNNLIPDNIYQYEDMTRARRLLDIIGKEYLDYDLDTLYRLITCPFDEKDKRLLWYWENCCKCIKENLSIFLPSFNEDDLEGCEVQYKALELGFRLSDTDSLKKIIETKRSELCYKIGLLLLKDKARYVSICRCCGKRLPFNSPDNICISCKEDMGLIPTVPKRSPKEEKEEKAFINFTKMVYETSISEPVSDITNTDIIKILTCLYKMKIRDIGDILIYFSALSAIKKYNREDVLPDTLEDRLEYVLVRFSSLMSNTDSVSFFSQIHDDKVHILIQIGHIKFSYTISRKKFNRITTNIPLKYRKAVENKDIAENVLSIFNQSLISNIKVTRYVSKGTTLNQKIKNTVNLYETGKTTFEKAVK